MIIQISSEEYFLKYSNLPLIDVRSPGEFLHGHVFSAINIPLFSDEERAKIGTVYKQESKEKAIELGYFFVKPKLYNFITESFFHAPAKRAVVHCWRGGMRSRAFAEHLDKNGFNEIYLIENGYKAVRNYIYETFLKAENLKILGGYTGSGKTEILHCMKKSGAQILDLEKLACHKGSAFGALGQNTQPPQEQFENNLFAELLKLDFTFPVWVEDESYKIGSINIPEPLFNNMRKSILYFIEIPKPERAENLCKYYAKQDKADLKNAVLKIKKRLGDLETRLTIDSIETNDFRRAAVLLLNYYDKSYSRVLLQRNQEKIQKILLHTCNCEKNAAEILFSDLK